VLVIEDLVSTGSSALDAVAAVRAAGAEVPAVLAIFSYGLDAAAEAFAEAHVPLHTLTDFPTLLQVAVDRGALSEDELSTLQAWRRDPEGWPARSCAPSGSCPWRSCPWRPGPAGEQIRISRPQFG
jgi:orotate phosphoribosyltransferase